MLPNGRICFPNGKIWGIQHYTTQITWIAAYWKTREDQKFSARVVLIDFATNARILFIRALVANINRYDVLCQIKLFRGLSR